MQRYDKLFEAQITKKTFRLGDTGMTSEKLQERLQEFLKSDESLTRTGQLSGTLYLNKGQMKEFDDEIKEFTKNYIFANPQHFDVFPSICQMEADVIRMTGSLFG